MHYTLAWYRFRLSFEIHSSEVCMGVILQTRESKQEINLQRQKRRNIVSDQKGDTQTEEEKRGKNPLKRSERYFQPFPSLSKTIIDVK